MVEDAGEHGADGDFEALLAYLKEARGFDFTGYKRTSLMRRVLRRMQSVDCTSFDDYRDRLEVHPDEFAALFNTILINVTGFFRDVDAWDHLRTDVLPGLLAARPSEPLRVWSAGCASGEEPYSLAMTLAELVGTDDFRERVKIYATDVDEEALAYARGATYTEREVRSVPPELLDRYFEPVNGRFAFGKDLRRCVIFGRNDLVQDAPISHIDLLVCRNALMYLNSETQGRVLQRLHFALNPAGVLFLGKAEMLLSHADLFTPVDLKRRFFRKAGDRQQADRELVPMASRRTPADAPPGDLRRLSEEALATNPVAQLVVDREGRLALLNHRAETLFGLGERDLGRPFQDLEVSYRPVELRSYVDLCVRQRRGSWVREIEWSRAGETRWLDVQLVPLLDHDGSVLGTSILFADVTRHHQLQTELEVANRQMETAYEQLQSTNEEMETTNEELQSTVEELETTNEELQSSNEELETMNEELQSMNDELQASNEELQSRTVEVAGLNQLLQGILASLEAAVAVVDRELRVLVWNHLAEDLWGLRSVEVVGEHLLNLDIGLPLDQLQPLVRAELADREGEGGPAAQTAVLEGTNRRGRRVSVNVTVSRLSGDGRAAGAVVLMRASPADPAGD